MTKEEEAIKNLEALLLRADSTDAYGDMEDMTPYEEAVEMGIQALETWNNLFKSYEALTKEITESGDIKNATKRIDDWCIEQLRGIISDYYADLIIKEM